ncbi:hypothetical protein B0H67DRAFT_640466 [Lasiosphaeris hirsuta]|uniref:Uncharacterized protein n=1 Tax=Lasiosphaeris hirsuta TaxID=260670 RepID=A0AA40BDB0_9PEZI|nr:hypothetical protein B0H67DRAFT_640466 [Lasiosphaeris hirsuta]
MGARESRKAPNSYLALIALSVLLVPFSAFLHAASVLLEWLSPTEAHRQACRGRDGFQQRTVLVTGVGTAKGLALARAFHLCGHRVIGADFEPDSSSSPSPARFSRCLAHFHRLPIPSSSPPCAKYSKAVLDLIRTHATTLWVPAGPFPHHDAHARDLITRAHPSCAVAHLPAPTAVALTPCRSFLALAMHHNLRVPLTHTITDRRDIYRHLTDILLNPSSRRSRFLLRPATSDAASYRPDAPRGVLIPETPTARDALFARLPVSPAAPWVLQEGVAARRRVRAHALVVAGEVRVFVASPAGGRCCAALPPAGGEEVGGAMLRFAQELARRVGGPRVSGHVGLEFLVGDGGCGERVWAAECRVGVDAAVVLLSGPGREMREMVAAYLAIPAAGKEGRHGVVAADEGGVQVVTPPEGVAPRYWAGCDLAELVFLPFWQLLCFRMSFVSYSEHVLAFCYCFWNWKEAMFTTWDPVPFFVLYHVTLPSIIWASWRGGTEMDSNVAALFRQ